MLKKSKCFLYPFLMSKMPQRDVQCNDALTGLGSNRQGTFIVE